MAEPFIGEIRSFAFGFAPQGWAQCKGQILQVSQNQALFTILGNRFGGDGNTTFALPNLQGRTPVNPAPDSFAPIGSAGGEEFHVLAVSEMPNHSHQLTAGSDATTNVAANNVWGTPDASLPAKPYAAETNGAMKDDALGASGASQGHENRQPFTVVNYCIALQGIWPPKP